jgi:hypothetical protein
VVADLTNDGIVGFDFMDENECTIDVAKKKIYKIFKENDITSFKKKALVATEL